MNERNENMSTTPTVSRVLSGGKIIELVRPEDAAHTLFAVRTEGKCELVKEVRLETGDVLVPVSTKNNLIRHRVVLLPEKPEPYGSPANLVKEIQAYLYRYVDLSDSFRAIASYYVLLSWVYDAFNELPYLRFRGELGSGKTRALKVIGSITYKPFFASGASTVSPIFHILDTFQGTFIFDEADFRFSDEKAELVKIFNNGNAKGFPVLRSTMTAKREFDPRAFHVFGPKIVAMRHSFADHALESRFLTEEMGQRSLRKDIPINLPNVQEDEARTLRNKLLMYRFENLPRIRINDTLVDPSLSPRLNQILVPLLSVVDDEHLRKELRSSIKTLERSLYAARSATTEGQMLELLAKLLKNSTRPHISVSEIAAAFHAKYGTEHERPITNRYVGGILRERLHLVTYKSHGVYVLHKSEEGKVAELCRRFGVSSSSSSSVSVTI